jgi:heat-inducible transcriptional repressor
MSEDRRLAVLRAIVEDYVATHEPVGSRALVDRHQLNVSPATVRNDMAALEDEGYIAQPHTSAGRIPTDKGYRLFVDRLTEVRALSPAERRAISSFLEGAFDLDDIVDRSVRLLAQLTRQVAVVQYPSLPRSSVRHVELIALSTTRVILVVIASNGRVEQRIVELALPLAEDVLADLRQRINAAVQGRRLAEVGESVVDIADAFSTADRPSVLAIIATLMETVVEQREERVVVAGAANLTRIPTDFPLSVQPVLEALEEHVVLLRLLGEVEDAELPTVRIGSENDVEGFATTSIVTSGYGSDGQSVATLGVVGPTRMDYAANMASVRAVARYLGHIMAAQ